MELNKVNTPYYYDYGTWIRSRFPFRVQKISVDAGFTCPNRDGDEEVWILLRKVH